MNDHLERPLDKVFVIGRNKTGTESIKDVLLDLGLRQGNQLDAERLTDKYFESPEMFLTRLRDHITTADFFKDVPFSMSSIYLSLYQWYSSSKFILTVRDPDEWYQSLVNYHFRRAGIKKIPEPGESAVGSDIADAIRAWDYVAPGFIYRCQFRQYALKGDHQLYDREIYISNFLHHQFDIINFFSDKKDQLLVIDLTQEIDTRKVVTHLGLPENLTSPMPHSNRKRYPIPRGRQAESEV